MRPSLTRSSVILCLTASGLAAVCLATAQERAPAKRTDEASAKPAASPVSSKGERSNASSESESKATDRNEAQNERPPELDEILQTAETFQKAYALGDAKAAAAHFTTAAEYIDE